MSLGDRLEGQTSVHHILALHAYEVMIIQCLIDVALTFEYTFIHWNLHKFVLIH